MSTCFVIQPFDNGKFDKRFNDIYKPAIEAAGLEAYRVDRDPAVSVPIESIEKGIKQASVCLADITADNPNVWYELGFAFASGKQVVMVCGDERTGKKYPFDIQHRSIIPYLADAPSDFEKLKSDLTAKISAMLTQGEVLEQIADADPLTPIEGLSPTEVLALAVIAGSAYLPSTPVSVYAAKRDSEAAGLTNMGFNLALRKLIGKGLIEVSEVWSERDNEPYDGITLLNAGWNWIEQNESRFSLHKQEKQRPSATGAPF